MMSGIEIDVQLTCGVCGEKLALDLEATVHDGTARGVVAPCQKCRQTPEEASKPRRPPALDAPTVHNNGTSGEELLRQLTDALDAGRQFVKALVDSSPNGRDYYVKGEDALRRAEAGYRDRMARVAAVLVELEQIAEAVAVQNNLRRRR